MCIKAILFDLDGTLLPMDQDEFTRAYFEELAATLTTRGYETKQLIETIWVGTAAMVKNDGSRHNEDAFWEVFLLTDCMINKNNVDISRYPHGDFAKLLEWINTERLWHIG